VPAIVTSRPVWRDDRLINQAVAIEHGTARALHAKHYFPSEPHWHEADWFRPGDAGFDVQNVAGLTLGVLLCTEAMFNEHARA
jgi:N-carbamoylputrescine amidase